MGRVVIKEVRIKRNLKVTIRPDSRPPRAEASFNAVVVGQDTYGQVGNRPYPRFFIVDFRKEDGRWKVEGYEIRLPVNRQ